VSAACYGVWAREIPDKRHRLMLQCRLRELMATKSRRERQKVTYRSISAATGISTSTLTRLATDSAERVALATIENLCAYFGCGPGDLFVRADERTP
jgi:DNA-binding Xre family transcriptional regulator